MCRYITCLAISIGSQGLRVSLLMHLPIQISNISKPKPQGMYRDMYHQSAVGEYMRSNKIPSMSFSMHIPLFCCVTKSKGGTPSPTHHVSSTSDKALPTPTTICNMYATSTFSSFKSPPNLFFFIVPIRKRTSSFPNRASWK